MAKKSEIQKQDSALKTAVESKVKTARDVKKTTTKTTAKTAQDSTKPAQDSKKPTRDSKPTATKDSATKVTKPTKSATKKPTTESKKPTAKDSKKPTTKPTESTPNEAVILLNMGGPNNLYEVELFLKNMFNDPNILTIKSGLLRRFVGSFITNSRLEEAKKNYTAIGGKSPLVELTFKLIQRLSALDKTRFYTYAMRYTPPFAAPVVEEIKRRGINKITLFSMYPQYSTTTSKSSIEETLRVIEAAKDGTWRPKISVIESYPTNIPYNKAAAERIKATLKELNLTPKDAKNFILLLSAHSLPQSMIKAGDPYQKECESNAEVLKSMLKELKIEFKDVLICYQSKLGPIKWLEPTTKATITRLKSERLLIYPLSFSIDNSETKYELEIEYARDLAREIGAREVLVSECLNDSEAFAKSIIAMLDDIK